MFHYTESLHVAMGREAAEPWSGLASEETDRRMEPDEARFVRGHWFQCFEAAERLRQSGGGKDPSVMDVVDIMCDYEEDAYSMVDGDSMRRNYVGSLPPSLQTEEVMGGLKETCEAKEPMLAKTTLET